MTPGRCAHSATQVSKKLGCTSSPAFVLSVAFWAEVVYVGRQLKIYLLMLGVNMISPPMVVGES